MTTTMTCWLCDGPVPVGHRSHRGMLINAIASISAAQISRREQLEKLQKRRWSKHHPNDRRQAQETMTRLELEISRDEALLTELRLMKETCYG